MQYKARVRTPAGRAKYGQEIGEVIVPDIPIGDIEFPKIGEVPEAQLIDNRLMFKPRDGSILDNKPNSDPYPVEWLYRAISDEEWDFINEHGYMQSDGRMNIAEGEGTVATPRDPTFYLPNRVGKRGRVVRIRYTPEDQWWVDHDGYAKTPAKIPIDRIDQVSPWYIAGVPMSDYTEDQLFYDAKNQLSNFVASMPDDYYEDPRPFHDFREPAWELTHSESPDEFYTALKDLADSSGNDVIQQFVTGLLDAVQSSREWMASVQEEKGIRRVRDPAFWGKPYGTRIVPGMKPAAQRPLPGISDVAPHVPEADKPRLARRPDSEERDLIRRDALYLQAAIDWYNDLEEDWPPPPLSEHVEGTPSRSGIQTILYNNYGVSIEDSDYGDPLFTGDWTYFGQCRHIREAAYDLLGFPDDTDTRTAVDPNLRHGATEWGYGGSFASAPKTKAWAILEKLRTADRSTIPMYRGVDLDYYDNFEDFFDRMRVGETFDLPVASFAGNKETAQRFGTSVLFKVERGARFIQGGTMGMPESLRTSLEDAGEYFDEEDVYDQPDFAELITGGRFKITHVTEDPDMGTLVVTIRQIGVFDPNTALAIKRTNERWPYAAIFDSSVRATQDKPQKKSRPCIQVKVRHVRDEDFWGKPYGTIITPGMKPKARPRIAIRKRQKSNHPLARLKPQSKWSYLSEKPRKLVGDFTASVSKEDAAEARTAAKEVVGTMAPIIEDVFKSHGVDCRVIPSFAVEWTNDQGGDVYRPQVFAIFDVKQGRKRIASIQRYVGIDSVYNELFKIDPAFQGQGIGSALTGRLEQQYRQWGITQIRTQANIDVGGYAWARHGFDFRHDNERQTMLDTFSVELEMARDELQSNKERVKTRIRHLMVPDQGAHSVRLYSLDEIMEAERQLNELIATRSSTAMPLELAMIGYKPGSDMWIGREFMMNRSWDGVKDL